MIDRNGVICFIHSGALTNLDSLNTILAHYTAEDYQTTVVSSIDQLLQENEGHGTQENPYVVAQGTTELTITLGAGRVAYIACEEVMPMSVETFGADVYVIMDGNIYVPQDDRVMVIVNLGGAHPVLVIGNSGLEATEVKIVLTILAAG